MRSPFLPWSGLAGLAFALCLTVAGAPQALAEPITGGTTSIQFGASADQLSAAGFTVTPLGTGALTGEDLLTAEFQATGGDIDGDDLSTAVIRHAGGGLSITDGTSTLLIEDLTVDVPQMLVFATVTADGTAMQDVPVFSIGPGHSLIVTEQASAVATDLFGIENLAGMTAGQATLRPTAGPGPGPGPGPTPVPEPGAATLLLAGLALLGAARRLRNA